MIPNHHAESIQPYLRNTISRNNFKFVSKEFEKKTFYKLMSQRNIDFTYSCFSILALLPENDEYSTGRSKQDLVVKENK